jgi:hypothetical protein
MPNNQGFEESLKAVHDAEQAVYEAQTNSNVKERQEAFIQLKVAMDKVNDVQRQLGNNNQKTQHRLHQAVEQLEHLENAVQALEE